jgi:hypothetical protein
MTTWRSQPRRQRTAVAPHDSHWILRSSNSMSDKPIVIFWSWQADSPSQTNRNFIQDCLEHAAKALGRSDALFIQVDRDTQGIGGIPTIAETILAKIRSADIFIWDGTLVHTSPRIAPNPNVMLELGYALATLGDGRVIGVMNTANGTSPDNLPFDLRHRRWPIAYSLALGNKSPLAFWRREPARFHDRRAAVRDGLVKDLQAAIKTALAEPKRSAIDADVNLEASTCLWRIIDSEWLHDWYVSLGDAPQYEKAENLSRLTEYRVAAQRAENVFTDTDLREKHDALVAAIGNYQATAATEMIPVKGSHDVYVISTKASDRWIEDYHAKYNHQVEALGAGVDGVWNAWQVYIEYLRTRYPSVVVHGHLKS